MENNTISPIFLYQNLLNNPKLSEAMNHLEEFCKFFDQNGEGEMYKTLIEEFLQKSILINLKNTISPGKVSSSLTKYDTEFSESDILYIKDNIKITSAVNHADRSFYAIKKAIYSLDKISPENVMRESTIMKDLIHPNIIRYYTSWIEFISIDNSSSQDIIPVVENLISPLNSIQFEFYLQTELCTPLNILDICNEVDFKSIINNLLEISYGIEYLHNQNIVHGKIKPSNILNGLDGHLKITDFSSSFQESSSNFLYSNLKDANYRSPEHQNGQKLTKSTDVYCFGIIIKEIFHNIIPIELNEIFLNMINENPLERPSIRKIIDFFENLLLD